MKLITLSFLALVILQCQLLSQYGTHQDEFINCYHEDEGDSRKDSRSTEIEFSVRPIQIIEMVGTTPGPQYVSIELVSDENIDSIKCLAFDVAAFENVELFMFDDGLNGDVKANDNIYTTAIPIQLASSSNPGPSRPFAIRKSIVRFAFYLNDGSSEKYSSILRSYFFTEDGYNQFQDHIAKNSVTQINDSTFYTSNIIHIVSDAKTYSSSSIDYNLAHFNDLDEVMGEDYGKEEILIYLSYNDIDKESGGSAATYWNGLTNYIRTKSFSYTLLNHETLHEWVGSFFTYDLAPNNGHWGFIERPTSAFGSGCYHGVFQDFSVDPSSGLVVGTSQNFSFHYSNLELFLMQRLPIDSVEFPLYIVSGEDLDCSFSGIENGILDSLSQEEFLARYDAEQEFGSLTDFGDTIEYKTVVLYDERLSDEVIHLLSFEIKLYEDFFAESTRQHCFASTSIFKDSDGDGFTADLDCDDTNPMINPDQIEEPYNGLDDDCNEETLDDDLDQDGFLLAEDCDDTNMNINPDQIEEPYNGLDDDCDEATLDDDLDQDGFLLAEDCDDTNMNINPDQIEEPYNGLDDDCDEETLDDDIDEDGFLFVDDCDDNNPDINPNAEEIANNGIDEDCDGMDLVTAVYELSDSEIIIYPNPVIDVIYIEVSGELRFNISLFDLNGKLILTSSNNQPIKVKSIPQGTYLLEIRDQNTRQKVVEKIVVGVGN